MEFNPQLCGHGGTATIGKGKPVILLRADMDALPITELSGEEFTCTSGNMHACGHDIHTAMLLTAARMLKEDEDHLHGTVKLMFQSAEEIFKGANDMIEHGILDHPRPDAAMAYHMMIGKNQVGTYMYNAGGIMMNSVDEFKITIHGKGTHGAYPHQGIDPIDEEREIRLQNSANSIGRLALSAKEIGAVLCIENLPRTCLGRDSGELMRLIADYPEVMVCFDSNHLLKEEHAHFFEAVGNRIGTIHASDYDRKDERHWLPGEGVIDWPDFLRRLQASGYKGVFMHEVRAGVNATPENVVKAYKEVILGKMKK